MCYALNKVVNHIDKKEDFIKKLKKKKKESY